MLCQHSRLTLSFLMGCLSCGYTHKCAILFLGQARPPLFSKLSLMNYQNFPARLLFFPWRLLPRHGTIAANTTYYPFGTRMFVPGYGWGEASSYHYLYIYVIALSNPLKVLIMGEYFFLNREVGVKALKQKRRSSFLSNLCNNLVCQVGEVASGFDRVAYGKRCSTWAYCVLEDMVKIGGDWVLDSRILCSNGANLTVNVIESNVH